MVAQAPTFTQAPTLPANIAARTRRAAALDLSTTEQVVSLARRGSQHRRRINRLRAVATAAASGIERHMQHHGTRYRAALVTVTYRPGAEWEPRDISRLLDHYRQWLRRRGAALRAVWVLELQKRGAPHYHLILWLPRGLTPPKPDKQGWWPKGATNCQWARAAVGYVVKYTSKGRTDCARLPHGARLHGVYGCPIHLGWWRAPGWLREIADEGMRIVKRPGGWWCVEQLAHAWRSPWRLRYFTHDELCLEYAGWTPADIRSLRELGW